MVVTIEATYSDCAEAVHPLEEQGWTFISFCRNTINFEPPSKYFRLITDEALVPFCGVRGATTVVPRNPGLRRKLECETAFIVSKYEHGLVSYSLYGEGMQCQFDTTAYAGLLLCSRQTLPRRRSERRDLVRAALRNYSDWCNGEVYDITVYDGGRQNEESIVDGIFGIIGHERMTDEVKRLIAEFNHPSAAVKVAGILREEDVGLSIAGCA